LKKLLFVPLLILAIGFLCIPVEAAGITVDEDSSDWAGISPIIVDPDDYLYDQLDVKEVYVTSDGNYIYFRIEVYNSITTAGYYRFFIDTDQNPTTGMPFFGIGAEYQIGLYNGYGYGMRIADWYSFAVEAAYSGSTLEVSVAIADIGNPTAFDLVVYCNPSDSAYPLDLYTIAIDQSITVDGDPSDWVGSPFFTDDIGDAVSSGLDLTECYVGSDGTDLFVMVKTDGVIDPTATGQVLVYSDMTMTTMMANIWSELGAGWTVWEASKPLSEIGVSVGDDIYVLFYLSPIEGEVAPNEGYATYIVRGPVGGEGEMISVNALQLLAPLIQALAVLAAVLTIAFLRRGYLKN